MPKDQYLNAEDIAKRLALSKRYVSETLRHKKDFATPHLIGNQLKWLEHEVFAQSPFKFNHLQRYTRNFRVIALLFVVALAGCSTPQMPNMYDDTRQPIMGRKVDWGMAEELY